MYLKSLVIRGFKSFADKAVLDFEPGITVVVGPNGSGKSNVVDAMAWVLGAQAPTAVRSQRMDDVIFAGTAGRAALGRAEVALTINNSDGYLPVEFTEVTVTRTLFRSGDSSYAINGTACRLLDIQELLSDAGVGRTQHVIASQGQLDAILNARPEERRTIIEEAAGVLKHRRRRERSERRLLAAEANLTRVNDLLREVRRGLRPLERQAEAARRHDEVQAELHQLRAYLAARELAALEGRLAAVAARRQQLDERRAASAGELAQLDEEVAAAEGRLRAAGGRGLADALARAERVRERARGVAAVLAERRRAVERELARAEDRSALAVLDAELERAHREELDQGAEAERLAAELAELGEAEAAAQRDWDAFRAEVEGGGDGGGPGSGEATRPGPAADLVALRREGAALQASSAAAVEELGRVAPRRARLVAQRERAEAEAARSAQGEAGAEEAEEDLARAVLRAEGARGEAEAAARAAEDARREAEADWRAWRARAEALGLALSAVRARAGADRLAGRPGVLGTLLDVVAVDSGWEAAFEAAAGEALDAVVVLGGGAALAALDQLRRSGQSGSVLPAGLVPPPAPSPPPRAATAPPPGRGEPTAAGQVRDHVRPRPGLGAEVQGGLELLLDLLVGGAQRVDGDLPVLVEVARRAPGTTFVSGDGDRFGPTGWRLGAAAGGATAALVEEAEAAATAGQAGRDEAVAAHQRSVRAVEEARRAHQQAVRAADDHTARSRQRAAAEAAAARAGDEAVAELGRLDAQVVELEQLQRQRHDRLAVVRADLVELEAAEAEAGAAADERRRAEQELARRSGELARRRAGLEARQAVGADRAAVLAGRRAELRHQLDEATAAVADRLATKDGLVARSRATDRLTELVAGELVRLEDLIGDLVAQRDRLAADARAEGRALDGLRQRRLATERRLAELHEQAQRSAIEEAELNVRREAATESARRDLDLDLDLDVDLDVPGREDNGEGPTSASPAGRPAPAEPVLPDGVDAATRARELERELRLLGPVNPLAVQEYEALLERHDFLEGQLADVKDSRRELAKVIRAIDDEISTTFAAAFADVGHHFTQLFATLFPGGEGALRLTDPDDLLDTGVDVEARPSGKNVRKLSLLSGGERSLTALGLLFAIFRSRPSPFYVLDEVEAALDDVNLRRFLDLLEDFRADAQLIVVSHQKRTMEIADSLYGVTLRPGESSKVVSERLRTS